MLLIYFCIIIKKVKELNKLTAERVSKHFSDHSEIDKKIT